MNKYFDIDLGDETPASVFVKLRSLSPSFLLESIERGVDQSRYSFLGLGVSSVVEVNQGSFLFNGETIASPKSQDEMMELFRNVLKDLPDLNPQIQGIPFSGGIVGFSSYDMVRYFESLPVEESKDGLLNPPDCAYLAPLSLLVFDHEDNSMALLHSGEEQEREKLKTNILELLKAAISASTDQNCSYSQPTANVEEDVFNKAVAKAKHHIFEGDIFQIVLSIAFSGNYNLDPFDVYRAMRLVNPSPYMFFCDINGFQVVGSSPEALVRLSHDKASLRPIAGTRPRGKDASEDLAYEQSLLADEKKLQST